jgi:hypothetical protein
MPPKYNPQNDTAVCDAGREDRDENDDRPDLTDEERDKARKIVAEAIARSGLGAKELTEALLMLGIYPGQETENFVVDAGLLQYCSGMIS